MLNLSRFKPALNLNRFLVDLRRGLNSLNSDTGNLYIFKVSSRLYSLIITIDQGVFEPILEFPVFTVLSLQLIKVYLNQFLKFPVFTVLSLQLIKVYLNQFLEFTVVYTVLSLQLIKVYLNQF